MKEYGIHPSNDLKKLFHEKPYQGADPVNAKILILGNDANYSEKVTDHYFFNEILEYHRDGIEFWKKNNVHHPFLLDSYPFSRKKGGVRYHKNFSKLNFGREYARYFSFIELLNIPTIGNTGSNLEKFYDLIDIEHLEWLEHIIFNDNCKLLLINRTLVKRIRTINKKFNSLNKLSTIISDCPPESFALKSDSLYIYAGYSFSHSITNEYIARLSFLMRGFTDENC